ncbi:hypothetical protein GF325_08730 [Candidatus Bathyarchaeota archaeon]|nr:hypothetical protein [Candidatus Bathyarchaeota archaeon]
MDPIIAFKRIIPLFTSKEVKSIAKEAGLRGYSSLNKTELIEFVIDGVESELMQEFLKGEAMEKLEKVLGNAIDLLKGKSVSGEKITSIDVVASKIEASFKGIRWETNTVASLDKICAPSFSFDCTCPPSQSNGLCVHYWALFLHLIANDEKSLDCLGDLKIYFTDAMKRKVERIQAEIEAHVNERLERIKDLSLEEILQENTKGSRYPTARIELRKDAVPKKKDGTPEEYQHVHITFSEHKIKPSILLRADFGILDEEGNIRDSRLKVLIDEREKLVAHENCKDFEYRMARQKQLCKHLIQVLLECEEDVSRRILAQLDEFMFSTVVPPAPRKAIELDDEIDDVDPDIILQDNEQLKDEVIEFILMEDEGDEGVSVEALKKKFGSDVGQVLDIMEGEGIITKLDSKRFTIS